MVSQLDRALCVDLDGTLLESDLLYESLLALLARNPLYLFLLPFWLLRGKAAVKRELAKRVNLDAALLPYDERVLEILRTTTQRPRVLVTASDRLLVDPIANHIGLFEEVIASDGSRNLAGKYKAKALVERFGLRNFDYVGNGEVDLLVWNVAASAVVVNAPKSLANRAAKVTEVGAYLPPEKGGIATWVRASRVYQWLKNLLVLVPLFTAHRFLEVDAVTDTVIAFFAFSLCASGVYVLNDLLDLAPDRQHPRKRNRPFASGKLPLIHGLAAAPLLTVGGFALALLCSVEFALVLAGYYVLTLSYSLKLKRIVMMDVVLLAGLYTVRIIGGVVAIDGELSFWLLAFSMFTFLSLALLKRYTELESAQSTGKQQAIGRGYSVSDLPLIQSMGAAAGYMAVMVFALYINSPESLELYSHPKILWLLCPVLLYWMSRIWVIAHRGQMHDDPIVYAATDRTSQMVGLVGVAIVLAAI